MNIILNYKNIANNISLYHKCLNNLREIIQKKINKNLVFKQ